MTNVGATDDIRFEVPQEDVAQDLCQLLESSHSYVEMTDNAWFTRFPASTQWRSPRFSAASRPGWPKGLYRSGSSSTAAGT